MKTKGLIVEFKNVTETRSKIMSKIRSKGSKIEDLVSKYLWHEGFRFKKNTASLFGKPDLSLKKYKVVIFIDSCFWHGCSEHFKAPKNNQEYWQNKIDYNKKRDEEVNNYYIDKEWKIIRIWEHNLKKKNFLETLDQISNNLKEYIGK